MSDRLRFITVIPPYEVHTSEARKVVPQEIPLSTAGWQMGRIAGMTRGLETGDLDLIAAANDDRILAKFLQVKLREQFPKCDTHILTCDTEGAQIEYL